MTMRLCARRDWRRLVAAIAFLPAVGPGIGSAHAAETRFWDEIDAGAVCQTRQVMVIGLGSAREAVTHLRVDRTRIGGRNVLRSVHRSSDRLRPRSDETVVDAATLHPISSVSTWAQPTLRLAYDRSEFRRVGADGDILERAPLAEPAIPEGPGADIVIQAVAWREGLKLRGVMVDRWRGADAGRIRPGSWSVEGRELLTTLQGRQDVYRTRWQPDDGSYTFVTHVTVARPHHAVRVQYSPKPGSTPIVSETSSFASTCLGSRRRKGG